MSETHIVDIVVRGTEHVQQLLCAPSGPNLAAAIEQRFGDRVDVRVTHEPDQGVASFVKDLESGASTAAGTEPNLVVVSVDGDISTTITPGEFRTAMIDAIQRVKRANGARVLVLNASSFDPGDHVTDYSTVSSEPASLRVHRLNLEAMRLSFDEGISVLDVDRLVAELGGDRHVSGLLAYSEEARRGIVDELVNVIEEYGYFDDRPLLEQVGSSA